MDNDIAHLRPALKYYFMPVLFQSRLYDALALKYYFMLGLSVYRNERFEKHHERQK